MPFPGLNHVAVTVKDLKVSTPWYQQLIEVEPLLDEDTDGGFHHVVWAFCLLYTSPSPRDRTRSRMPSSA